MTLMPVLASLFLKIQQKEKETWIIRQLKRAYRPVLQRTIRFPKLTLLVAILVFASSLSLVPFMGAEFIPRLDEGAIAVAAWRLPSVSLEESVENSTRIEAVLLQFPEVVTVVSRTGQAEIPTDPMGVEMSDVYVILKPPEEWETAQTKEELIEQMDSALKRSVPMNIFGYSQPIELRVQELIAGVRSDVAIQIYGEDLEELKRQGDQVVRVVSQVSGAVDVKAEQVAGLPYLRIMIDRRAIARYGINASEVLDVVRAIGGRVVGQILEGQRRFFFQVRFQERDRADLETISNLRWPTPGVG
jgi:cobalt-zinc-cadmium resistance protein CzcA